MAKQSGRQKEIVGRVMHEFKLGELESAGRKVRNPRQAIAIGLSEAGASNQKSAGQNRSSRAKTEAKERKGETARQREEGRGKVQAGKADGSSREASHPPRGPQRADARAALRRSAEAGGVWGLAAEQGRPRAGAAPALRCP